MLTVAHRAGNDLRTLRRALDAGVDLVEADVHRFRRALEVRHCKSLGPHLLWDRVSRRAPGPPDGARASRRAPGPPDGAKWELVRRRGVDVPSLPDVLAAAGANARLMLDLKGPHPGLAPAVAALLRAAAPDTRVVVCTRHWWMLKEFAADPHVLTVLSAGSRRGLRRLRARLRHPSAPPPSGVCVHRRLLTPAIVAELRDALAAAPSGGPGAPLADQGDREDPALSGLSVLTWPVDGPAELAEARRLGVTGIISKSLPLLLGVRAGADPRAT